MRVRMRPSVVGIDIDVAIDGVVGEAVLVVSRGGKIGEHLSTRGSDVLRCQSTTVLALDFRRPDRLLIYGFIEDCLEFHEEHREHRCWDVQSR